MEKANLVIDLRMINSSGIGVYLKNIIPEISKKFNITLLGNKKELKEFSWANGVPIISFTAKIYSLKEQLLYPFVVPKTTLFWCPHFNAPILPIRAKTLLTTIYDVNHLANKEGSSFVKWLYAKMLYTVAVKRSKKIITISKFSKSELLKYTVAKEKKIEIVYCGVNYDFFATVNNKDHGISKDYILFVGNVKPHKNLITLLKAYKRLPSDIRKNYKLLILGKKEGFITPDLEIFQFIEQNDLSKNIIFTGFVKDEVVPLLYQNATLFVFPSLYEGFGLPILEAMAGGVAVLSSDAASLPEVGEEAVTYFKPKDYNDLAQKIEEFIGDKELRDSFIEKGKIQARKFLWKTASTQHIRIIEELLYGNDKA